MFRRMIENSFEQLILYLFSFDTIYAIFTICLWLHITTTLSINQQFYIIDELDFMRENKHITNPPLLVYN